jgi:hypothetical protein
MDITNATSIDTEYRVTSPRVAAQEESWRSLGAHDYAVVNSAPGGPWKVELRVNGGEPVAEVVDSPKASVVLEEEVGGYRVQTSVAPIDAFILYTPCVQEWAEKLDVTLQKNGLSTWIDYRDMRAGISLWEQLEKAVSRTDNIVVLVGMKDDATERQRNAGSVALGSVYESPHQRMIPILLGDAKLPSFVRSAANWTQRPIPSLLVRDPSRDWDRVVSDLVEILQGKAEPQDKGQVIDTSEEDRRRWEERMESLRQFIAELKAEEERTRLERLSA